MYRVIEIKKDDFRGTVTEKVYWQGADSRELSEKYPPSKIFGADKLEYHQIEDGWIRWQYRFESSADNGKTWVECKDPTLAGALINVYQITSWRLTRRTAVSILETTLRKSTAKIMTKFR